MRRKVFASIRIGPFAVARAFDGFFRGGVNVGNVVAVDDVAVDAVSLRAVGEIFDGNLAAHRSRIRPAVIFENENERRFLRRGEIQSFVEHAGRAAAVADPRHRHNFLSEISAGHRDAGHHRDQIAEHRNRRNDVQVFEVAEVARAIFTERRRSVLRHMLRENVARRNTLH